MVGVGGAHWLPGGLINQPPFTIVPKEARMERTCLCQQEKSCSWNGAPDFCSSRLPRGQGHFMEEAPLGG